MKVGKKMGAALLSMSILLGGLNVAAAKQDVDTSGNDEHRIVFNEPPSNWDPTTASDEELQKYAYPERPQDPSELVKWKEKVRGTWVKPDVRKTNIKGEPHKKKQKVTAENTIDINSNWGGLEKLGLTARATGFLREPVATASTMNRPAYSSQWVGIGGDSDSVLIQAGTTSEISSNGTGNYDVWYEIVGTNLNSYQMNIQNFSHAAGDTYYFDVKFNKGAPGSASFYISDSTKNVTTSFTITNVNYNYDLYSAEWIFERPKINGSLAPNLTKPDVGYVHFSQSQKASTTTGTLSYVVDTDMKNQLYSTDLARAMALPGIVSSTGTFDVTWYNYN